MQQGIICAFKWECLRVIATICICLKNLMEECVLLVLSHILANHLNIVKIRANAFPSLSSSVRVAAECL